MQTISKIGGGDTAAAVEYYTDASAKNVEDYYLNKGEPPGKWKGHGCKSLGLESGEFVNANDLQSLLDGYHAENGTPLAQNAGKDKRVAAFDIGFSAGKDLSIIAGISDEDLRKAIIEAHQSQVERSMEYMQDNLIYTRRGKDGTQDEQAKGIAYANFNHMTSRGGDAGIDPLLHDHNLIINSVEREDGTFGTIDGERLYETKMAMGALYRAGLVNEIKQKTGIELEVYETDKGHYDFRVVGMPDNVRKSFSQRREQIEEKLEQWKASLGDAEAAQAASLQTRSQKDHIDREALNVEWSQRASELGLTPEMLEAIANGKGAELEAALDKSPEQLRREWAFEEKDGVYNWKQLGDGSIPAFSIDNKNNIRFASKSNFAVQTAVQIAVEKGWTQLKLSGSKEFRRQVWLEAKLAGIENVKGYRPTKKDIEELEERKSALEEKQAPSFDMDAAIARLTDKNVRFSKADILKTVAEEAMQKGLSVDDIEVKFDELIRNDELVKLGVDDKGKPMYTTKSMYAIEQHLKESVVEGVHDHRHHLKNEKIEAEIKAIEEAEGFTFSQQQRDSIFLISEKAGRISTINGKPGTGKSTTMKVIKAAYEKEDYELIGCAIAGKAAAELEDGSGIKSQTLDSLLIELESGKRQLGDKTIIALDEAGMCGSEKMDQLVSLVNQYAGEDKTVHLVALGDIYQLQPVNAGPGAKVIQQSLKEHGQETVLLDEIRRQKDQYARDAALDFSVGRAAEGLAEYYQRDKIQFYDNTERNGIELDGRMMAIEGMVKSWLGDIDRAKEDLAELKEQGSSKAETFGDPISHCHMIALSRAEVYQANVMAHEHLKQQGNLGDTEYTVNTKFGEREFCLNERVIFTKNNKQLGTMNGWTGTITEISERNGDIHMTVLCDNGTEITFSNNEIKGEIDYGMCATNHKGQGLTKDYVQLLAGGSMTDMEAFNVELTRHRKDATIHINHAALEEMMLEGAPTEEMAEHAKEIAEKRGIDLPDYCLSDINACQDFIDQRPPTPGMINYANQLAEQHDLVLPDDYSDNFSLCRAFLNDHSKDQYDDRTLAGESSNNRNNQSTEDEIALYEEQNQKSRANSQQLAEDIISKENEIAALYGRAEELQTLQDQAIENLDGKFFADRDAYYEAVADVTDSYGLETKSLLDEAQSLNRELNDLQNIQKQQAEAEPQPEPEAELDLDDMDLFVEELATQDISDDEALERIRQKLFTQDDSTHEPETDEDYEYDHEGDCELDGMIEDEFFFKFKDAQEAIANKPQPQLERETEPEPEQEDTIPTPLTEEELAKIKEINTLALLAELASQSRQKESTLEYLDNLETENITELSPDDPRSQLTQGERLKIAMQISYEKDYKLIDDDQELPGFDSKEQKVIRKMANDRLAESVQTDTPLDQQAAYRVAAKDWMAMRSIDRREEMRKDAAHDFVKEKELQQQNMNSKQNIYQKSI